VPLAGLLVAAGLLPHAGRRWPRWSDLLRLAAPAALVVLPWLVEVRRWHLFQETNAGAWEWSRGDAIWPAVADVVRLTQWNAIPFVLLLLPAGMARRRTRRLALVLCGQVGFYLFVFYTGPVDTGLLVATSLPRLLLHVVPAALVGTIAALSPAPGEAAGRA
jgi:hypothetical protein